MSLTNKQRAFVEHYLQTWNATEAARRAGYSERSARISGSRNMTNVDIAAEIRLRLQAAAMSADEVLTRMAEEARGAERTSDRIRALENMGKHFSLFSDKLDLTSAGEPIKANVIVVREQMDEAE